VIDPQTKVTVFERQKSEKATTAATSKAKKEQLDKKDLNLDALGSGSDYSSFLQHIGIPSLNLGFGGEDDGGEYHSIYDSYDNYARFKDPGFNYGVALSKTAGHAALRMANANVLPFDFRSLQKTIDGYVSNLTSQLDQMRESTIVDNQLVKENYFNLANDPTKPYKAPVAKVEVPYLDFSPLQNALAALGKSAGQLNTLWAKVVEAGSPTTMNEQLYRAEQQLLSPNGLPRRNWYKHTLYAPGFYTGYGVKTMPGIREAIEQRNWTEAQEQIAVDAAAINRLADYLLGIK
ncbi:MAG: folate hydrolase, partial [Chitinophagaceae bacterium]|nr:folate hydrolase [Chitinophagaceae bacterium]